MNKFSSKKASQKNDIPIRIVKENANFFVEFCVKVLTLHSNHQCFQFFETL